MMQAKNVRLGIKNGMTLKDFCKKYQCDSEQFRERMGQIYNHDKKQLKKCLDQLATNEKKARRDTESETEEDATEVSLTEEVSAADLRMTELMDLTSLEMRQSQKVMALESEHKTFAAEHRELRTKLRTISDKIDQMMSEFQKYHQEFESILSRNAVVEARMNEISAEWNVERTALEDTRARIEELSTLTLCVYASGEIAPMEGCDFTFNDTDWESTRDVLLLKDECQELRVKDVGVLARLLMIVEHADCRVEIVCDDDKLEKAFRLLSAS